MTLRIGFDMDGVLADMDRAIRREAEELFGPAEEAAEPGQLATPQPAEAAASEHEPDALLPRSDRLTASQQRRLWRHLQTVDGFWESLDEIEPGAVARLWSLTQQHRWEVIFLTKRPRTGGLTSQLQTHRWLQDHGYLCPSVFVVQGSRGKIAAALDLDFVVDDTPDNCVDVLAEARAQAILVVRGSDNRVAPSARRLGIRVVGSVNECLDILAASTKGPSHTGVVARLTSLLGLEAR